MIFYNRLLDNATTNISKQINLQSIRLKLVGIIE